VEHRRRRCPSLQPPVAGLPRRVPRERGQSLPRLRTDSLADRTHARRVRLLRNRAAAERILSAQLVRADPSSRQAGLQLGGL
ncbi:MAG: hypothetical protein AVDCRST_MAG62-1159, partial [uncultured Sphingomonas sp.]